jgi:hypothetical protein
MKSPQRPWDLPKTLEQQILDTLLRIEKLLANPPIEMASSTAQPGGGRRVKQ